MDPIFAIIVLFAGAMAVLALEVFLPSHGVLGFAGVALSALAIVNCFRLGPWVGTTALLACVAAIPVYWSLFVRWYPRTPVGRKMVLQEFESRIQPPTVRIGATGVALSELRPTGQCEFGQERFEARSDAGLVSAGTVVRVVNIRDGRVIVRPADASLTSNTGS